MSRNRVNAARFSRDLVGEATDAIERRGRLVLGKAVLDAMAVAVERSPVDTGALRNNWQVGVSADISNGQLRFSGSDDRDGEEGAPPNERQLAQAEEALARMQTFGKLYLVNPMPYASFVDEGTPYMAARPMVEPAIATAEAVIRQASEGR